MASLQIDSDNITVETVHRQMQSLYYLTYNIERFSIF